MFTVDKIIWSLITFMYRVLSCVIIWWRPIVYLLFASWRLLSLSDLTKNSSDQTESCRCNVRPSHCPIDLWAILHPKKYKKCSYISVKIFGNVITIRIDYNTKRLRVLIFIFYEYFGFFYKKKENSLLWLRTGSLGSWYTI